MKTLNIKATAFALTSVAVIAYALCAVFRPLFPEWPMYQGTLWQALFPGFSWTTVGILIGLLWTVAYAVFGAVVFASAYNIFLARTRPVTDSLRPTHHLHHSS
ncbi:MAG: hypothetical protein J5I90_17770 [Caldilineales bacterium]|nr:hypothetical protein [Caldilineales bacterium]